MTLQEAKAVLSGPLVFGDTKQIEAVKTIEQFESREEKKRTSKNACPECNGTKKAQCWMCDGTGETDCDVCDGTGKDLGND